MEGQGMEKKIEKLQEEVKIPGQIEKNKSKAGVLLKDKKKLENFLERLERKLSKIPLAGKYLSGVPVLISLVKAYVDKEYTEIPIGSIIAIISGLMYVLSPFDIIPDAIPAIGFVDDAAVIATVYILIQDDIEEYKIWRDMSREQTKE